MVYDREFLTGTMSVLILSLLGDRAMHTFEIQQEAELRSARQFQLREGTIYPVLRQMERDGLLTAEWREGETERPRKYYVITSKGQRAAESKRAQWTAISAAMRMILESSPE